MLDDDINPYASPSEMELDFVSTNARVATQIATIVPVPEPYYGRVMTLGHNFGMAVILCIQMILLCGIPGLIAFSAIAVGLNCKWPEAMFFFVFGVTVLVIGVMVGCWFLSIPICIYWRWALRKSIRQRPDPWVCDSDPDSKFLFFSSRVNQSNIGQPTPNEASGVGLLKLDEKQSEVLIEGDCEQFRIPRGSVLVCEPNSFHEQSKFTSKIGLVRLVVQLQDSTREIRFCLIPTDFKFHSDNSKRLLALDICQRIDSLSTPKYEF